MNKESYTKEDAYRTLENITSWIQNCDNKVSILLASYIVIIATFLGLDYINKIVDILNYMFTNTNLFSILYIHIFITSIIFIVIGFAFLIRVLFPKMNLNKFKHTKSNSILYFSSISKIDNVNVYKKIVKNYSEKNLYDDILSQIYINSTICNDKFKKYKNGLLFSILGIILFLLSLVIGTIIAKV